MYIAIYKFEVKENQTEQFITVWEQLTHLFIKHAGALGSRLHELDKYTYIAYAQWPNAETYATAGDKMPEQTKELREIMRSACKNVETVYKMKVVNDLLIKE